MDATNRKKLARVENAVRDIGRLIARKCPRGVGFALLMFDFGPDGFSSYVSNGRREDMIRALREQIMHLEAGTIAPPGQPNHPANNPGKA